MNTTLHDEPALLQAVISGDTKAQQILYNRFAQKMYPICFKYAKNESDADDMLQEGFIKLFNNLHRFRGEGSFDGWVRRIFVNTAIEQLRKRNATASVNEHVENVIKDTNKSPLDNLYEKDLVFTTDQLSDGYKTVFKMYVIDGFSHKEIAAKLGITESTSKSQFSRAKALLRDILLDSDKNKYNNLRNAV
jgi:RNA polymerase sigma factor (sigma-70 family)